MNGVHRCHVYLKMYGANKKCRTMLQLLNLDSNYGSGFVLGESMLFSKSSQKNTTLTYVLCQLGPARAYYTLQLHHLICLINQEVLLKSISLACL